MTHSQSKIVKANNFGQKEMTGEHYNKSRIK